MFAETNLETVEAAIAGDAVEGCLGSNNGAAPCFNLKASSVPHRGGCGGAEQECGQPAARPRHGDGVTAATLGQRSLLSQPDLPLLLNQGHCNLLVKTRNNKNFCICIINFRLTSHF